MDPQLFLPSSELPRQDWTECSSCDTAAALNGDPDFIEESAGAIVVSNLGRTFTTSSNKNNSNNSANSQQHQHQPLLRPFSPFVSTSIASIADPTSFLVHHVEIPPDVVPVACPPQILETVLQQLRSMRAVPMKQLNLENDEYQVPERENTNVLLRFRTMPPAEDQFINLSPSRMPIVTFAVVYAPTAKAEGAQKALNYLKRRMSEAETKGHLQLLIVSPEYQIVSSSSLNSAAAALAANNNSNSNGANQSQQQLLPQPKPKPRSSNSSSSSSASQFGNNKIRCIIPGMPEPSATFVHIPWCVATNNNINNNQNNATSPVIPAVSSSASFSSAPPQQQQQTTNSTSSASASSVAIRTPYDTKVILQNFCVTMATAGAAWASGRLRSLTGTPNASFFATALDEPRFSLLQGDNDPSGRLEMRAAKYRADLHLLLGRPVQAYRGLNHRQLFVRSAARGPGDFLWICSASDTLCAIRWLCLKGVLMTAKRDADWIFANRACFADSVAAKPDDYEKARKTLNGIWGRWSNALRIDHTGKSEAFDCYVAWAQQFQWSCTSFDGTLPEFNNNNTFSSNNNNNNNTNNNNSSVTGTNGGLNNNNNSTTTTPMANNNSNNINNASSSNNTHNQLTEQQREQMKAQRAIIISQQCVPAREFDDFLDNIFHDFEEDLIANIQSLQDVGSRVIFTGSDRIAAVPRLEAEARYLHFLALRCIVQPTSVRAPRILLSSCRDFVRKYLAYAHGVSKELNEHFSKLNNPTPTSAAGNSLMDGSALQPKVATASPSYIACLLNGLDRFKTIRFGISWLLRRAGLHRSAVEFLREALCSISSMIYASYNNNNGAGSSTSSSTAANAIIASPIHDPVLMMELWTELLRWVGVNVSKPLSAGTLASSSTLNNSNNNSFLTTSSFYQQCGGKTFIESILPEIEKASPNRTSPITGDIVRAFVEQAFSGIVFAMSSSSSNTTNSTNTANNNNSSSGFHGRTLSGQSKSFPPNFTAKQLALQTKRQHITAAMNTMRIRASTLTLLRINDSFFSDEICVDFFRRFLSSSGSGREMQSSSLYVNYNNNNNNASTMMENTIVEPSSTTSTSQMQMMNRNLLQQRQLTTALQTQQQSLMMQTSLNASPNGECGAGLSVIGVEAKPLPSHLAPQPVRSHGYMEGAFKDDYYYAKNPLTNAISRTGPVIWVVDEVCVIRVEIHNAFVFPLQVDRVTLRNNNKNKNTNNVGIAFDSTMLTIPAQQTLAVDLFFQPVVIGDAELDGVVWTSSMLCGSSELEFFSPFPVPLVTPVMDELPSATLKITQDLSVITPYDSNSLSRHNNNNNNLSSSNNNNSNNSNNNNNISAADQALLDHLRFQPKLPEITIFQGQKVEIPIIIINTGKTAIPLTQEKLDRVSKMWYSTMNASAHEQHCQLRVCSGCASVVQILAPDLMGLRTLDAGEEFMTTLVVNPKEGWIVPSQSTLLNSTTTPGPNGQPQKITELSTVTAPAAAAAATTTSKQLHSHSYSLSVVSPRMIMHKYSQSMIQQQQQQQQQASSSSSKAGTAATLPPPPPFFVPPAVIQPVKSNVRLEVFASKEPPFTIDQSEIAKLSAASSVFCHLPARVQRLNLSVNILPSVRALSVSLSASKRILVSMINDNREWAVEMKREVHVMSDRGEILDTLIISGDVLCGPGQTQPIITPISSSRTAAAAASAHQQHPQQQQQQQNRQTMMSNVTSANTSMANVLSNTNNNMNAPEINVIASTPIRTNNNPATTTLSPVSESLRPFVSPTNNFHNNNTPVAILKDAYSLVFHWQYLQCYEKFKEGKTEVPLASIRHQISDRFSVADLNVAVTVASEEIVHCNNNNNEDYDGNENETGPHNTNDPDDADFGSSTIGGSGSGSLLHRPFVKTIKKWNPRSTDMVVESDETIAVDVLGNYRVQVVVTAPKSWLNNNNNNNSSGSSSSGNNNNNNNTMTTFDVDFDIPGGAMIDGCTNGSLEFKNQVISLLSSSQQNNNNTLGTSRQGTNLEFYSEENLTATNNNNDATAASSMKDNNNDTTKKRKSVHIVSGENENSTNHTNNNTNNNVAENISNKDKNDPNYLSGFSFTGPSLTSGAFEPSANIKNNPFLQQDETKVFVHTQNNNENKDENKNEDELNNSQHTPINTNCEEEEDAADADASIVMMAEGMILKSPNGKQKKNQTDQQRQEQHEKIVVEDDLGDDDDDDDCCVVALDQKNIVEHVSPLMEQPGLQQKTTTKSSANKPPSTNNSSINNNNENNNNNNDSLVMIPNSSVATAKGNHQQQQQNGKSTENFMSRTSSNKNNNQNQHHHHHENTSTKRLAAKIELDCLLFAVGAMKLRITLKTGRDTKTFVVPLLVQASHY